MSDLFLSDDPPPRRPRPRWVDRLGLAAIVASMLAIGVLGDRGAPDDTSALPTSTTTTWPSRRGRPVESTTTTTGTDGETTTTVVPVGPALPFATGTSLLLSTGNSAYLLDVDRGAAARVALSNLNAYGAIGLDDGFVIPGGGRLGFLAGGALETRLVDLPGAVFAVQLLRSGPHTFWSVGEDIGGGSGINAVELDAQGAPTGRQAHAPSGVYVAGAVDDGVIVNAHGSLTLIEAGSGRARSLGTGDVLAAGGRWVVRLGCELLTCRAELVDVRTGRGRALPGVPDVGGYVRQGLVSGDGRWVALSLNDRGTASLTVVNTANGRSWTATDVRADAPVAFSVNAAAVFAPAGGQLCAFETDTGARHCLDGLDAANVQVLAAAPDPGGD